MGLHAYGIRKFLNLGKMTVNLMADDALTESAVPTYRYELLVARLVYCSIFDGLLSFDG